MVIDNKDISTTPNSNNYFYLREICLENMKRRGVEDDPWYAEHLDEELKIIDECGLNDFFLNTSYIINMLKAQGVFIGAGRGSCVSSVVCYLLNITSIPPKGYGLSFSRFLNKTRMITQMPDIDSDSGSSDRKMVLQMIKEAFGVTKTYQIITLLKFSPKVAIKDLSRIINIDFEEVNRVTATMDEHEDYTKNPNVVEFLNKYPFVADNIDNILGLIKSMGVHPGAEILLPDDVENYASTVKVNNVECICYDGLTCESLLFLKNDMLSVKSLDTQRDCLELINKDIKLPMVFDDPKVYETINKSTLGIFQLEQQAGTALTKELHPDNFSELIAVSALIRPGARNAGTDKLYCDYKFGRKEIEYEDPRMKDILNDTRGLIIYQENAMALTKELAGMTDIEADGLRRAISKKKKEAFTEFKPKFINGCINNNVDEETANSIWDKIEKSSEYSFNKSHSYSYAVLGYHSAWLKTYYPIEFYLAMLNNTDSEDKRMRIYNEIKSIDKNIKNPDINKSKRSIISDGNDIYLSFSLVKGVGDKAIDSILEKQPYTSFDDFMERKDSRKVNKRVVKALIESGAFDCFDDNRGKLMHQLDPQEESEWTEETQLFKEFQRLKINPMGNVLELYDLSNYNVKTCSLASLNNVKNAKNIYVKVMVSELKVKDDYAFLSITDNFDNLSLFCSKQLVNQYLDTIKEVGHPILAKIQIRNRKLSLVSVIDLKDMNKYEREFWTINGECIKRLEILQKNNPNINVGITKNVSYFKSRKGNQCCSYDIMLNEDTVLEGKITCMDPPHMIEGSYIFFYPSEGNDTFINIKQVI
jgi:DNA polymerase-3 subunit alpha